MEQFYWKKQLLAQRDQLLESIGRTVFKSDQLPPAFADLPRAFHLKDTLLDHLRDRKAGLREARSQVIAQLDGLDRAAVKAGTEIEENLGPFHYERDQVLLRFEYAQDQAKKGTRQLEAHKQDIEDMSCRIKALDLRIAAGEKHRKAQLHDIEDRARPLRDRLLRLNKNIGQTLREDEQLRIQVHRRLRDLGYFYLDNNREPEKFAGKYAKLNLLITDLADHRQKAAHLEPPDPPRSDAQFWKWMLAAIAVAALVIILFRTQYQNGEIDFSRVAESFLPQADDYRFYVDLNQAGTQSWHDEIPDLEDLPGGSVFGGMRRQDILAFMLSRADFGQGELRFCGIKLRKTPARFAYRLAQQGWHREPTKFGYEALSKGAFVWMSLTDREFILLPKKALPQFEVQPERADGPVFRLEQRMIPMEKNPRLLQGLDQWVLVLSRDTYQWSLIASKPLADAPLRRQWLAHQMQGQDSEAGPQLRFLDDRLVIEGGYDPLKEPFKRGELATFLEALLARHLSSGSLHQPD